MNNANLIPFTPGQSGNPGGRPKVLAEVKELAREHTVEAVEALAKIMLDEKAPAAARVTAANAILDRAYGKPPQAIEVDAQSDVTTFLASLGNA